MSTSTPNSPVHNPNFTSTLHQHQNSSFNLWLVILTAVFFFLILAWYNVFLAFYNYFIGHNPNMVKNYN